MPELNPLAVTAAGLLRAIDAGGHANRADLARAAGRLPANITRDLGQLADAGLITADQMPTLTDEGRAQLAAIARAEHGGQPRKARGQWAYDKVRRNPANRPVDPDKIAELADAILGARAQGGLLQRALLTPPDANGVRMLLAGERRWLALQHLAEQGLLTDELAWLADGLPFEEREATDAEATLITIVENTSREELNPLDDAEQLYRYQQLTGLSARQIAKLTGRSPADSNRGERDVQLKIKIAREATDEAKAEYRRTGSWDALRDSVTRAKPPEIVLTRDQRLALAELRDLNRSGLDQPVPILPSAFTTEGARLQQHGLAVLTRNDKGDTAAITRAGIDYLEAEGLTGSIEGIRERLKFPPRYGHSDYTTAWLNAGVASAPAPSPEAAPEVQALAGIEPIGEREAMDAEATGVTHVSQEPRTYVIRLIQYARANGDTGWQWFAGPPGVLAPTDGPSEFLANDALALRRAIDGLRRQCGPEIPAPAQLWLDSLIGPHVVNGVDHYNAARAGEARRAMGWIERKANSGGGRLSREGGDPATAPEPTPEQAAVEQHAAERFAADQRDDQARAERDAEALLARTRETLARNRDWGWIAFSAEVEPLLKAAGAWGPFSTDPNNPGHIATPSGHGLTFDLDAHWPDPVATAVAEILAEVLNRALGIPSPDLTETGAA